MVYSEHQVGTVLLLLHCNFVRKRECNNVRQRYRALSDSRQQTSENVSNHVSTCWVTRMTSELFGSAKVLQQPVVTWGTYQECSTLDNQQWLGRVWEVIANESLKKYEKFETELLIFYNTGSTKGYSDNNKNNNNLLFSTYFWLLPLYGVSNWGS